MWINLTSFWINFISFNNDFIIDFRGMAHHWLIDLLDLYITIEKWIISRKSYARAKVFSIITFMRTNNCTINRPTSLILSRRLWSPFTLHSIPPQKHRCSFFPCTHRGRTSTTFNLTTKIVTAEKIQKTISSQLQEDSNSRNNKVCSANRRRWKKNSSRSNNKNHGYFSPHPRLKREKK